LVRRREIFAPDLRDARTRGESIEGFHADAARIDLLLIAEAVGPAAAKAWRTDEREAIDKLIGLARIPLADDQINR
jgi:hypothetical protein